MATGDLTTIAAVKSASGIGGAGSSADAELTRLVSAASSFIAVETDRTFSGAASFSEIRNGSGGVELFVANAPLVSVQSLTVDQQAIPAQPADGQPGFVIVDQRSIYLEGYAFNRGRRNVRVSYTAGFASVPLDVAQACIELVISAYKREQRGIDMQGETLPGGQTVHWSPGDLSPFVRRILAHYRKVVPV